MRVFALASVLIVHGLGLAFLAWQSEPRRETALSSSPLQRVEIELSASGLPPPPAMPMPPAFRRTQERSPATQIMRIEVPAELASDLIEETPETDTEPRKPRLFSEDGGLVGMETHVDALARGSESGGRFDYEIAGLSKARTAFRRPKAIEYHPTAFDESMRPTQDMLTSILEKAVQAATLTVKIPVPGAPGHKVVCSVVVIAAAGGCGMERPDVLVLGMDDPNTLSPEEAKACEVIWEKITTAKTQEEHLRLRRIYDMGCRLPLAN